MKRNGFTLIEIMIVVTIIAVLLSISIPNFFKTRQTAQTNSCLANLKCMQDGKNLWAIEKGGTSKTVVSWSDLVPVYIKTTPSCPAKGTYSINTVDSLPTCSESGHELH